MTLRGNTSQACAACKYQRRKCTPDCPLAPYFPPDQQKMFQNVHKLFGVKKIQKILESLHPTQHHEAMSSLIYQANMRDRFPVLGCVEVIQLLHHQIGQCEDELFAVNSLLAMHQQQQQHRHQPLLASNHLHLDNSQPQLQLGMATPHNNTNDKVPSFCLQNPPFAFNGIPVSHNHSRSSSNNPNNSSSHLDPKQTLANSMWIQQCPYNSSETENNNSNDDQNNIPMHIQSQLVISESPPVIQQHTDAFQDYDEMHPYFDSVVDRQSFVDSKGPYDSSPESSSMNDTTKSMEHFPENELKSAAACFRLTSVN